MKTYCLVVHNSDEVKAVFVGPFRDIMKRILGTSYSDDIEKRSLEWYNNDKRQDAEEKHEGYINVTEIPFNDLSTDTLEYMIERLYHDGDSEDGYTIFNTDLSNQVVLFFKYN